MKKSPRLRTLASQIRKWRVHLDAQSNSGLSRAEYCRQHDLSYHAFGYWRRKLHWPLERTLGTARGVQGDLHSYRDLSEYVLFTSYIQSV